MINIAAFAGDLFALGLLPVWMVHDSIIANLAYANQVSTVHCRALHLFLLHAKAHTGPAIGLETLGNIRRQLVRCIRGPPMSYDRMAQLWVIVSHRSGLILVPSDHVSQECCAVIDKTVEQDRVVHTSGGGPAAVSHQWDMVLSKDGWFSALTS